MTHDTPETIKLAALDPTEERVFQYLIQASKARPEIEKVILFGSRARRTHRPRSDFDIAIYAPTLSDQDWVSFALNLEENIPTLCGVDLVRCLPGQKSPLQDILLQEGVTLYVRKN